MIVRCGKENCEDENSKKMMQNMYNFHKEKNDTKMMRMLEALESIKPESYFHNHIHEEQILPEKIRQKCRSCGETLSFFDPKRKYIVDVYKYLNKKSFNPEKIMWACSEKCIEGAIIRDVTYS